MHSQGQHKPGGIGYPVFRILADSGSSTFKSSVLAPRLPILNFSGTTQPSWLNTHPALQFRNGAVSCSIPGIAADKLSIFTVYHIAEPQKENIIWSVMENDTAQLVLTDKRAADLASLEYLNFTDLVPGQPKIDAFVRQASKQQSNVNGLYLQLGKKPSFPLLPIENFSGIIPEMIIYDRVLNTLERNQVCSYLAIKYGVTLSEPGGTYLDRQGNIIWNGSLYPEFHHNIAGIGRDDSSSLLQVKASSQNAPGLFSIQAISPFNDNDYFIWGDNALHFSPDAIKKPGLPVMLQNKQLVVNSSSLNGFQANIGVDTRRVDAPVNPATIFWMAIDSSGTGDFTSTSTQFRKMTFMSPDGIAHFKNTHIGFNTDKKAVLGFTNGGKILLTASIHTPDCNSSTYGSMLLKAWGVRFPCRLTVKKENAFVLDNISITGPNGYLLNNISSGYYIARITDADNEVYSDSFYVSDKGITVEPVLEPLYYLNTAFLELDAGVSGNSNIRCQWLGPEGFSSNGSKVSIATPGVYTLRIERNGCQTFRQFRVVQPPKNVFTSITVSPNPAPGVYSVAISLDKKAPVTVEVISEDGRRVAVKNLMGMANYYYSEELSQPGIYFLNFRSGLDVQTKKLVIIR